MKFPKPGRNIFHRGSKEAAPPAAKDGKSAEDKKFVESINEIYRQFKEEKLRKERFAILGVGNDLKGDDGVGPYVAEKLKKLIGKDEYFLFIKTAMPEDHVRELKAFTPTLLIIVDAADFGKRPGSLKVIRDYEISDTALSTHITPLSIFLRLYNADQPVKNPVTIIGIQKKSNEFGQPLGSEARVAGDKVAEIINDLYRKKLLGTMLEKEFERQSSAIKKIESAFSGGKKATGK
ncbi:MAG: hydrogenase 3 maturation endopeptidase HyCI [Candidatus Aenigmarchaeota archaeon]|nr:hydrogenase 3 maturation endopeptidase HyCI [Candidatus Aenigmarchaeota archaeon]